MDAIDLRSDTVTWPTPTMRQAMAEAELGDDVKREDPTVIRLDALAADRLGKQAALLVTSGTQGNITALLTPCGRGDEYIVGQQNHIVQWEGGGGAVLGGAHPYTLPVSPDGTLNLEDIARAVRGSNVHHPRTRLICLENTHGGVGGVPVSAEYFFQVRELARDNDLRMHLDGARVWNAAAALKQDVAEIAAPFDSVTFCLSKGLCAPVGSVLVGSRDFIEEARHWRKVLGGGMRQAGVIAAAGIVALQEMTGRLSEDHATAQRLAEKLAELDGIHIAIWPQTNMVFFSLDPALDLTGEQFSDILAREHNVLLDLEYGRTFRAVTHYWISPERVDRAVAAIWGVLKQAQGQQVV
ncbi:MAG: low-specificity L-threonine aldolase [Anaerolineae bacterium]